MKKCFKCSMLKPLTMFYKHSETADGYLNKCKTCTRSDVAEYRKKNIERVREYDRERSSQPNYVASRVAYSKTIAFKISSKKSSKKWKERNREKRKASMLVSNAIKAKKLTRLSCEVCGNIKTHGHHDDYKKPLDVRWLCHKHHMEFHKNLRAQNRGSKSNE